MLWREIEGVLNGLDLFSGIGGLSIALAPWVRTIAYCENDRYAQSVLLSRMRSGDLDCAPIWDDIRTLRKEMLPVAPDIIFGGFPCQGISVAGLGLGLDDPRSGLFTELFRLVETFNPPFVFLENVPAIRTRGAKHIAERFSAIGYDAQWDVISASSVGARFIGDRWFFIAAANGQALREQSRWREGKGWTIETLNSPNGHKGRSPWASEMPAEPRVFRDGNGIPFAVDRDRCLGNAVVPIQARQAFQRLMGIEK